MKVKLLVCFLFMTAAAGAQTQLIMEGKSYVNSEDTWLGVNIARTTPTRLIFRNNTITSVNRYGYMLQAGDESPAATNNNLDGAIITGNKFNWSGSDMKVIPHGLFTGHNSNVVAKYNYLSNVPMGIVRKSGNNMSNTGGGVAYNIVKSGAVGMVVKGMSNVNVYNNTFYTDRTESETWRPLLHIYTNTDGGRYSVAHGTKIYNNIFYTKYQTFSISVDDAESLNGLECDYNVYWCENGSPRFNINGSVKTFAQWQAMGYDKHSVVINPGFRDLINFVPSKRLDYGKDLGLEWKDGLAVNAKWGAGDPATASQNGTWQVGAVVYAAATAPAPSAVDYVSSVISSTAPDVVELTFNSQLANVLPPTSAFTVSVSSVKRNVVSVSVSGSKVFLKLESPIVFGNQVTVSYSASSPMLQSTSGAAAASFSQKPVTNNVPQSAAPLYGSSNVQDGTADRVEVTYNMELANIIPPKTAFSLNVNGSVREVLSVTVSGSIVSLQIATPVIAGDKVILTYVVPSTNPLQSVSGSASASFADKLVTNNVKAITKVPESVTFTVTPEVISGYMIVKIANSKSSAERVVKIQDFSGKTYIQEKIGSKTEVRIPVDLDSGVYILQIEDGTGQSFVRKVIVV